MLKIERLSFRYPGSDEAVLHEEAGRALLHAPLWSTSSLLPFLPASDQLAVAAGETSWTLALGPLVPDLDTTTNVAMVGGDTVWELALAAPPRDLSPYAAEVGDEAARAVRQHGNEMDGLGAVPGRVEREIGGRKPHDARESSAASAARHDRPRVSDADEEDVGARGHRST